MHVYWIFLTCFSSQGLFFLDAPNRAAKESFDKFVGPIEAIQGGITTTKPQSLENFSEFKVPQDFNQPPPKLNKQQKVLKELFIPLPPENSPAGKAIEGGAPVSGLPFPINMIVSDIFRKMRKGSQEQVKPISVSGKSEIVYYLFYVCLLTMQLRKSSDRKTSVSSSSSQSS